MEHKSALCRCQRAPRAATGLSRTAVLLGMTAPKHAELLARMGTRPGRTARTTAYKAAEGTAGVPMNRGLHGERLEIQYGSQLPGRDVVRYVGFLRPNS